MSSRAVARSIWTRSSTIALFQEIHNEGWEVGAFYHSHPTIDPVPSSVDVSYAQAWPDVLWIIVGWRGSFRYLGNNKWKRRTRRAARRLDVADRGRADLYLRSS